MLRRRGSKTIAQRNWKTSPSPRPRSPPPPPGGGRRQKKALVARTSKARPAPKRDLPPGAAATGPAPCVTSQPGNARLPPPGQPCPLFACRCGFRITVTITWRAPAGGLETAPAASSRDYLSQGTGIAGLDRPAHHTGGGAKRQPWTEGKTAGVPMSQALRYRQQERSAGSALPQAWAPIIVDHTRACLGSLMPPRCGWEPRAAHGADNLANSATLHKRRPDSCGTFFQIRLRF